MKQKINQKRFTLSSGCLHAIQDIAQKKHISMSAVLKGLIDKAYQSYIIDKESYCVHINKTYLYIAIKQCKSMSASQKAKILSIYEKAMR